MTDGDALPRRRRIVNRLVIATLVAGLGAGVIGSGLLQRSATSAALSDARDRSRILAEQYAVRLDSRIDSLLDALRLVASRAEIGSFGPAADGELRVVLRVSPTFDELILYDATGTPTAAAASRFLADPRDYSRRLSIVGDATAGDVVEIAENASPTLGLAVAVENPPGNVVGALLARAPLEAVGAPLEDFLADDDPVPFLVDRRGGVLVHRDRSRVLSAERFPIAPLLADADGVGTIDREGTSLLVAAAASQRLDATVVVEQAKEVALAPIDERRRELIVILLATTLATVVAVIIAGELVLRPLRPLTAAVARVGRGERGVRTDIEGYGEIGLLAGEVDRMAEALDRREEQVGELRDLSLLVGSLAERNEVAGRVANGAAKLVRAEGSAVCTPPGANLPIVEAVAGTLPHADRVDEVAAGAVRTGGSFQRSIDGGDAHLLAVPLLGADDEPRGALVVHRRGRAFDGEDEEMLVAFAAFAAVAVDNAHRLELQHALIDQLQDAVDRRRDLIGTITHEFRTPLACIEGFSSALLDGWASYGDDERLELIARISRHTEELDDLVTRFLDFAVTERGALSAQVSTVTLDALVGQSVDALAPLLAERRVEVDVPAVSVAADPALLRRTLTNLISNAVKYSSAGSLVAVRAVVDGARVRVDVIDEGTGLSAHDAARAFEPFWRGGDASTRSTRGAGLGLALVAEYLRAMGGSSGVTSEPGRGSTFFFTLALATVPASDNGDGEAPA